MVFLVGDLNNLGDALIAQSEARYFVEALPVRRLYVAAPGAPSSAVRRDFAALGVELLVVNEDLPRLLRACAAADVMIGGGQVIRESLTEKWLLMMLAASLLVRASGGVVRVVGAGATPIGSLKKRIMWGLILAQCERINMRDASSSRLLRALFPRSKRRIGTTADVVFLAPPRELPTHGRYCVLSPAYDVTEERSTAIDTLVPLLRSARDAGLFDDIVVVPHDVRPNMDLELCAKIADALTGAGLVARVGCCTTADALAALYDGCSLVVTARLHGLILGALASRPVLSIDDTEKLAPFVRMFGYPEWTGAGDVERSAALAVSALQSFSIRECAQQLAVQHAAARANFADMHA